MLRIQPTIRNCGLAFCVALPLLAQQESVTPSPSDPVFRTETVLMEVEVKVTDKQGQPILDLKPEDFTLLEDGEPQTIRTFEYVSEPGGAETTGAEIIARRPEAEPIRPGEPVSKAGLPQGTTWVYITGRVNREDRKHVRREMTKFLDETLQPGVLVSIRGDAFTSKRTQLNEGLERLIEETGPPASPVDLDSGLDDIQYGDIEYDPDYQIRVDSLNEAFADLARQRMRYSGNFFLYQYVDMVKSLSVLPGKKIVVLLVSGPLGTAFNKDVMRRLVEEGVRARVAFYIVEATRLSAKIGYVPDSTIPGYSLPPGGSVEIAITSAPPKRPILDGRLPPGLLANPTGGKAAKDTLGLGRVLTAATQSLGNYYVLGYTPPEPDAEGRRKVRIQVNRPEFKLSYPELYYDPGRFNRLPPTEKKIELRHSLKHEAPFTDIPLTMDYDYFRADDGEPQFYASIGIRSGSVPVVTTANKSEVRFIALAHALDAEGNREPVFAEKHVRIQGGATYLDGFQQDPSAVLHVPLEMKLSPGKYKWKVVLRDEFTGRIGSYTTEIDLPDLGTGEQSSSLLLTGCYSQASAPASGPAAVDSSGGPAPTYTEGIIAEEKRFYVDSTHIYRKGDPIYLVYDLYGVQAEQESALPPTKLMLMQGQQQVEAPTISGYQYHWRPELSDVRYILSLDSAELEPGAYQLLAVLPNGKSAIHRNFRLVSDKAPDLWLDPEHSLIGCGIQ